MNATANLASNFSRISIPLSEFWRARNGRERGLLGGAAALIVLSLIYLVLIDPAISGREQLGKTVPALRQQVAELQDMSRQVGTLPDQPPPVVVPVTRETIEASLLRKGLKPQNLALSGGTLRLQLASASFAGIVAWLDEMQKTASFTVSDANIVAQSQPDMVDATLTLQQRKSE